MKNTAQQIDTDYERLSASGGAPEQPVNARRKAWLAAALSLMLPGLGQLYNAKVNLALWLFMLFALVSFPGIVLSALYFPDWMMLPTLILCAILSLLIWLFSIVNAYRDARHMPDALRQPWQTVGLFVLVFLVCHLLILPSIVHFIREYQVQAFRIPSSSMAPTVLPGDYLFADMRYNCPGCRISVQRGDVAIFVNPNNRNQYHIKRIIGLPGDHIKLASGVVSINGQALSRSSSQPGVEQIDENRWTVLPHEDEAEQLELNVPDGAVFVLGDNRSASLDSRAYGALPLADVVGKAKQIWYSSDSDGIRWRRVGRTIH